MWVWKITVFMRSILFWKVWRIVLLKTQCQKSTLSIFQMLDENNEKSSLQNVLKNVHILALQVGPL